MFKSNSKYEILTPSGWQDFSGVQKTRKIGKMHIQLEYTDLECSTDHPVLTDRGFIEANQLFVGENIHTENSSQKILMISLLEDVHEFYEAVEVNNGHQYYTNDIISHNCQFMGSSGTLISGWKLKQLMAGVSTLLPLYEESNLHQFEKPEKDKPYVIIADVSAGKGLDYSAFHVIDVSKIPYVQVATYKDNMTTPIDYVTVIHTMAKHYNDAYVLVETNAMGGEVVDRLWEDFDYENIFYTESAGRAGKRLTPGGGSKATNRGIITSKPIRDTGCSMLKLLVEQNQLLLNDMRTVEELTTFSKKTPTAAKYEAEEGKTDDLTMGLVLFGWMTNQEFFKEIANSSVLQHMRDRSQQQIEDSMLPMGGLDTGQEDPEQLHVMDNDVWSLIR